MNPLHNFWLSLSNQQKRLSRETFNLNSTISIDSLTRRLSQQQTVDRFVFAGEKLFAVFALGCLPHFSPTSFSSTTTLSLKTICDFMVSDSAIGNISNDDPVLLSKLFFFLFACVHQGGDEAKPISFCTNESQEEANRVVQNFFEWTKENKKEIFLSTAAASNQTQNKQEAETKEKDDEEDDDDQEYDIVLEDDSTIAEAQSVAGRSSTTNIIIGHSTNVPQYKPLQQQQQTNKQNNDDHDTEADLEKVVDALSCTNVAEFNNMRKHLANLNNNEEIKKVLFDTIPLTIQVEYVSQGGSGGVSNSIYAYGNFCCGGVRPYSTANPNQTKPSHIKHRNDCCFHPLNAALLIRQNSSSTNNNNNNLLMIDDPNGTSIATISAFIANQRRYHSGALLETRITKSSARKAAVIATWSCCRAPAVVGHNTQSYQFIPEEQNGCRTISNTATNNNANVFNRI